MNDKPDRRSIRLPDWDYRREGYYFITFCTHERLHLFADERLHEIATLAWTAIPTQPHAKHVQTDESVIMPDHGHGILRVIHDPLTPLPEMDYAHGPIPGSIGAVVGNYKMLVTKRVKAAVKMTGTDMKVWQRGYWERIIRNERELEATRQYIRNNPRRWAEDRENLDRLLPKMRYVDTAD